MAACQPSDRHLKPIYPYEQLIGDPLPGACRRRAKRPCGAGYILRFDRMFSELKFTGLRRARSPPLRWGIVFSSAPVSKGKTISPFELLTLPSRNLFG